MFWSFFYKEPAKSAIIIGKVDLLKKTDKDYLSTHTEARRIIMQYCDIKIAELAGELSISQDEDIKKIQGAIAAFRTMRSFLKWLQLDITKE